MGHGVTKAEAKRAWEALPPVSRPVGRPSKYSHALAERICNLMKAGKSLLAICNREDMPERSTVVGWAERDLEFSSKLYEARASQADLCDDMMIEISKNSTSETAASDAVKFKILAWRAGRLNAKRYGDKTEQTNTVKHQVTHIHLVAPDENEATQPEIDADFTLLPHPLEQE